MKTIFTTLPILILLYGCATFTPIDSLEFDTITIVNRTEGEKSVIIRNKETIEKVSSFFSSIDGWKHYMGELPEDMKYMVFFINEGQKRGQSSIIVLLLQNSID